ncbi:MAG: efflux RND transporter periplasmic adaptor subunit [Gammaproteobacteria bacterium]|nr:efflux RND transporter periplasmic adaptor subunit [Gammaproteobacteria bacterium]MCP5201674.1 efflux RND transporter periplasmic adaptor subunit [Gammaproteobacteria bacterium]
MPAFLAVFLLLLWSGAGHAADGVPVRVAPLSAIALYPEHTAPATVVSDNTIELSAEIAARVVEFQPRVGDVVDQGAVVARLDCRDYRLELEAARAEVEVLAARLALAERRLTRARELEARQSLAVEILDEREAERTVLIGQIKVAEARIARDEVAASRCVITSPFRALLRERLAPLGDYVGVGDPVAALIDVEGVELSAEVLAGDVATLRSRETLGFVAGGRRYPVRLRVAVDALSTGTRNRELRLVFTAERPLVGTPGELSWADQRAHVPGRVLVRRGERLGLFVVTDGRARFVALPEAQEGRASAVELPPDSAIVVDGHYALNDGDRVQLLGE